MSVGDRLIQLREDAGFKTRKEFAQTIGIPETTLRNYEKNEREPGHSFLKKISEYFNVSADYILCLTDEKEMLHQERLKDSEQKMVEKYRSLDSHGRKAVDAIIDLEYERCAENREAVLKLQNDKEFVRYAARNKETENTTAFRNGDFEKLIDTITHR